MYTFGEGVDSASICVVTPGGTLGSNLLVNISLSEDTEGMPNTASM